jgi:hypothetical protein
MPLSSNSRDATLARKRAEYHSMVETTFARGRDGLDQLIWHQIEIDVPRTRPGVRLWMLEATQRCLERILYVWAIRHPASGYVQGINDLVTPFFQVFMSAYIGSSRFLSPRSSLITSSQKKIQNYSTLLSFPKLLSMPLRLTHSGASQGYLTGSKTTTSRPSQVSTGA